MVHVSPFWNHISLQVQTANDGHAVVTVQINENLLNHAGTVQGGVLATLIDVASGEAISSTLNPQQKIVTTDLTVHYVLPGTGNCLKAIGDVKHKGRSLAVANAEVYDEQNQLIALGSASFRILD